jgi:hypothetical protein
VNVPVGRNQIDVVTIKVAISVDALQQTVWAHWIYAQATQTPERFVIIRVGNSHNPDRTIGLFKIKPIHKRYP